MMQTIEISCATVLEHHLAAFVTNDLNELMRDYTEDAEVWTENGIIKGADAIRAFFAYAFGLFPKGATKFSLKKQMVEGNKAFIIWEAEGPAARVPLGVDTFIFEHDKIVFQSAGLLIQQL
jgi:ketosteroid isomerase-like protein